jgi:hypothetical protein
MVNAPANNIYNITWRAASETCPKWTSLRDGGRSWAESVGAMASVYPLKLDLFKIHRSISKRKEDTVDDRSIGKLEREN